jgi:hemin uptake protein HemP
VTDERLSRPDHRPAGSQQAIAVPAAMPESIDTQALMGGKTELRLLHRGQEYRLRVTRQGKLILTK